MLKYKLSVINTGIGSWLKLKSRHDCTRVIMTGEFLITGKLTHINLLKPTCYLIRHQFNTQQL